MLNLSSILRTIGKVALGLVATVVIVVALWFAANRMLDEPPDPKRIAYLSTPADQVTDGQNIAVGIVGLAAPSGVDPMAYGAKIKALPYTASRLAQIRDIQHGAKALRLTVDSSKIRCWTDLYPAAWEGCLPLDQVPSVLAQNKELLERYRWLYRLDKYVNVDGQDRMAFLDVLNLSVADMRFDLRQHNYESAYRNCRDQLAFIRKILRGTDSTVGKAVALLALGMTLPILDDLVTAHPDIVKEHTAELQEILYPTGMETFNPEGLARAEFRFLDEFLQSPSDQVSEWQGDRLYWLAFHLGQKNRILNRLFAAYQEYGSALRLPHKQVNAELDRVGSSYVHLPYWDSIIDPFGSMFVQHRVQKLVHYRNIPEQMYLDSGRFRLAVLQVRILQDHISDDDIPKFLAAVDPSLYDPFSDTPMHWIAKDRKIYVDYIGGAANCWFPYARIPTRGAGPMPNDKNC